MFGNNFFMKITKRRFLIFCLIVLVLVFTPITKPVFYDILNDDISYYFYASSISDKLCSEVVKCGNAYIVQCNAKDAGLIKKQLNGIQSESVRIKNYTDQTYQKILQKYGDMIVKTEAMDDMTIMLCYDKTLPQFAIVSNIKVNTQIAITKTEINIGYPLILNGY